MITLELLTKAVLDKDHEAMMEVGRQYFNSSDKHYGDKIYEAIIFSLDIKKMAYTISDVGNVETYINNFFNAIDEGLIERAKVGKWLRKASLEEYLSTHPLPVNVRIDNECAELIYKCNPSTYYSSVAFRHINETSAWYITYKQIVYHAVHDCYDYYLAHDPDLVTQKLAYTKLRSIDRLDTRMFGDLGTTTEHGGLVLVWENSDEDGAHESRKITTAEAEQLIKYINGLELVIQEYDSKFNPFKY